MTAKQTLSASLVLLHLSVSPALADDDADAPATGEVQPQPPDKIELMPKRRTGTFAIGVAFNSDEGFGAMYELKQPRLFGTDKGLLMRGFLDKRRIESLVRYEDPTFFDDLRLRVDVYNRTKLWKLYKREAAGGEISLGQRIAPNLDFFVGYKLEHVKLDYGATSVFRGSPESGPSDAWDGGLIGAVRSGLSYSTLAPEDLDYPHRGTTAGVTVEVADKQLGSEIEYVRTDGWLGLHRGLGPFTLHLAGRAAAITESAPMSERLHFDGMSDVRGYGPDEVMPEGANVMWTTRAELETPSVIGLSLAGFFDAGGMYNRKTALYEQVGSVGVGIVWRSPIGPLRFDWAVPLGGPDLSPRFVFGIGGAF